MNHEMFSYWKRIYFLFGKSFSHDNWVDFDESGTYKAIIHGHPTRNIEDDNIPDVPYIDVKYISGEGTIYSFNDTFFEELENE